MIGSTLAPAVCDRDLVEPTLEVAIAKLWGRVVGGREVSCPWCGGTMRPRYGAGPRPVAARCADCGTSLS